MALHRLEALQNLPVSIHTAWDFLSSPANLKEITPPQMGFTIHSGFKPGEKMYAGMIINYTVKPILGIPLDWVTEITHVSEPDYFVDEQRKGPYSIWHHKHFLKEIKGGVEMIDIVDYEIPFGYLGNLLNSILIKRKIQDIFEYRRKKLEERFGVFRV